MYQHNLGNVSSRIIDSNEILSIDHYKISRNSDVALIQLIGLNAMRTLKGKQIQTATNVAERLRFLQSRLRLTCTDYDSFTTTDCFSICPDLGYIENNDTIADMIFNDSVPIHVLKNELRSLNFNLNDTCKRYSMTYTTDFKKDDEYLHTSALASACGCVMENLDITTDIYYVQTHPTNGSITKYELLIEPEIVLVSNADDVDDMDNDESGSLVDSVREEMCISNGHYETNPDSEGNYCMCLQPRNVSCDELLPKLRDDGVFDINVAYVCIPYMKCKYDADIVSDDEQFLVHEHLAHNLYDLVITGLGIDVKKNVIHLNTRFSLHEIFQPKGASWRTKKHIPDLYNPKFFIDVRFGDYGGFVHGPVAVDNYYRIVPREPYDLFHGKPNDNLTITMTLSESWGLGRVKLVNMTKPFQRIYTDGCPGFACLSTSKKALYVSVAMLMITFPLGAFVYAIYHVRQQLRPRGYTTPTAQSRGRCTNNFWSCGLLLCGIICICEIETARGIGVCQVGDSHMFSTTIKQRIDDKEIISVNGGSVVLTGLFTTSCLQFSRPDFPDINVLDINIHFKSAEVVYSTTYLYSTYVIDVENDLIADRFGGMFDQDRSHDTHYNVQTHPGHSTSFGAYRPCGQELPNHLDSTCFGAFKSPIITNAAVGCVCSEVFRQGTWIFKGRGSYARVRKVHLKPKSGELYNVFRLEPNPHIFVELVFEGRTEDGTEIKSTARVDISSSASTGVPEFAFENIKFKFTGAFDGTHADIGYKYLVEKRDNGLVKVTNSMNDVGQIGGDGGGKIQCTSNFRTCNWDRALVYYDVKQACTGCSIHETISIDDTKNTFGRIIDNAERVEDVVVGGLSFHAAHNATGNNATAVRGIGLVGGLQNFPAIQLHFDAADLLPTQVVRHIKPICGVVVSVEGCRSCKSGVFATITASIKGADRGRVAVLMKSNTLGTVNVFTNNIIVGSVLGEHMIHFSTDAMNNDITLTLTTGSGSCTFENIKFDAAISEQVRAMSFDTKTFQSEFSDIGGFFDKVGNLFGGFLGGIFSFFGSIFSFLSGEFFQLLLVVGIAILCCCCAPQILSCFVSCFPTCCSACCPTHKYLGTGQWPRYPQYPQYPQQQYQQPQYPL